MLAFDMKLQRSFISEAACDPSPRWRSEGGWVYAHGRDPSACAFEFPIPPDDRRGQPTPCRLKPRPARPR
jgi:hypothetical protein